MSLVVHSVSPTTFTFVAVEALGLACERATRLGGKVLSEKIVVPGVGTSSVIQDPQGAVSCLFKR